MSLRELVFRLSLAGQSEFARDLRGVNDLVRKSGVEEVAITNAVARSKRAARDGETRHQAALLRTQIAFERARAKESVRETERTEKAKTKTATTEEKARQRAVQGEQRASIRAKVEETRAFERAEREKTRIAMREAKARQREEDQIRRATMRAEETTSKHIFREREKAQRSTEREAYQRQRDVMFDHKRLYRGIGTGIADGAYGAIRSVYGAGMGVARSISSGMGLQQAWDVSDVVSQEMQLRSMMRAVSIEARTAGGSFGGFDEKGALGKIRSTAARFGLGQRDLAEAIDVYSEKGSGATAVENIHRIGSQAKAMGTSAAVVAKLRAQMGLSSKISGKELSEDEKDDLVAKMHFVGKTGVFRAEDLARESESLFSSFAKGGGDFRTGFTRYISFANEARKSVGSGAMARTAIMGVQDSIAKKEGQINKLGVKTRDSDGGQRDFIEVVMDVITKTGAKGTTFNKIFDPSKSGKAIATMVTAFNEGSNFGKNVKGGRAAMEKMLEGDESIKKANVEEMAKDWSAALDDPAAKIQQNIEKIRQALADKLGPVLDKLAANAPAIAEAMSKAFSWIEANPWKAAGGLVAGGALKGAALPMAGAALRFAGDSIANHLPGFGKAAGVGIAGAGGMITQAGSQPVYITGAAPGVMPSGGGGGGAGGGGGPMSTAGAALIGAAIAVALGAAIANVITDTQEAEAKAKADAEAWRESHPNAGGGMKSDPDYLAKRYGPGAKNPDALGADYAMSEASLASPYADPKDYIKKHLDPSLANSPYASVDDADFATGSTGSFRFDKNPTAGASPLAMPVGAGQSGFGVLKPVESGAAPAAMLAHESEKLAEAMRNLNKVITQVSASGSQLKAPPLR
jgi:ElaB/YqjD/DUF883 family membrane-anchored ribosome-binding protein/flagellar biosynthesis GTPase FlhF